MWFLDSSAILKLIVEEPESKTLRRFIPEYKMASRLSRLEVLRNVHRIDPKKVSTAREKLDGMSAHLFAFLTHRQVSQSL